MQNFITYIFEISILTSLFFLFYRYMYYKLAYFLWNRYFFYVIILISVLIPFLPPLFYNNIVLGDIIGISDKSNIFINVTDSLLNKKTTYLTNIPLAKIIFIIWVSGFIRYSLLILKSIISIIILKKKSKKEKYGKYTIIRANTNKHAFSFFKNIFVNKSFEKLSKSEQLQIFKHEEIHANQKHTIDNLFFEFFRAIFWFNPISKMITTNVQINNEFIVDNKLTGNKNIPDYSRLILKLAAKNSNFIGINSFANEEIKNRITIINSSENEKIRKKRFTISIPVLILLILACWIIISTTNIYAINKKDQHKDFYKPFAKNTYVIISPFFENKKINNLSISHKEVSYEVKSFSNIYSVTKGIITNIKVKDIYGLKEYTITQKTKDNYVINYKGIYKTKVKINEQINKGETIGISGDIRLFPKIDIKITKGKTAINPENIY